MSAKKITVVGSFITDLGVFTPRFPRDGETVLGSRLVLGPGGKGSNQATAAARSGGDVSMITKIGRDTFAGILRDHYEREKMTTEHVYVSDTAETGTAMIEINEATGENRIVVMKGANDTLTVAEIDAKEKVFADCDIVLLQLEANLDAVAHSIELAKRYGKPVVLNPAPPQVLPDGFFRGIDFVTPNETEAEFFTGIPVHDAADAYRAGRKLIEMGARGAVITLGKRGAAIITDSTEELIPTTDLKPVDTTGAGDAFNGGFAVALAEGMDVATAVRFANCVASISVTRPGTSPAMPYRYESDALFASFYGNK